MRLSELLDGVEILKTDVSMQESVSFIFSDSRKANNDGVFVAIKGEKRDGNNYIEQVLIQGAKCVITDDKRAFEKYKKCILVENARRALAYMWNNYYDKPASKMKIVAITGTNGKTSCAYFLYNIFKCARVKRGLISTINCLINDLEYRTNGGSEVCDLHSAMTTPDPEVLYSILYEMYKKGVEYVVMEASSHALEQSKLAPIRFKAGIFTNLSPEHLDFHKNMVSYFKAKRRLLLQCDLGVINVDDEYGQRLFSEGLCDMISASIKKSADAVAYVNRRTENGCEYSLKTEEITLDIECKICGEYSVYNSMLVALCALEIGIEKKAITDGISSTYIIPGRLEKIENNDIYIDYAHTPYAMEKVLNTLRECKTNKQIWVLFGCGGDRDKSKRAEMGRIASNLADNVIITTDNPRTEEPLNIIIDILQGVLDDKRVVVIPNRKKAIGYAIESKGENDVLLLLGKGHEEYEIDKCGKHYFSEKALIKEFLDNDKNKSDLDV